MMNSIKSIKGQTLYCPLGVAKRYQNFPQGRVLPMEKQILK